MKIFENKKLFKKLIILFVLITVISFCVPKGVQAKGDGIGGVLLKPITSLFLTLGDGIVQLIHSVILQQSQSLLNIDLSDNGLVTVLAFVIIAIVVAVAVIAASGALVAAAAKMGITLATMGVGTVLFVSVTGGTIGAVVINSEFLEDDIRLPIYRVTPEEIFANKIPTFDVDFFNPSDDLVEEVTTKREETEVVYEYKEKLQELKKYGFTSLKDTYVGLYYREKALWSADNIIAEVKQQYNATDETIKEEEYGDTWYYRIVFAWNYSDKDGQWRYQLQKEETGTSELSWSCIKFTLDSSGKAGEPVDVFENIREDQKREETKTVTENIDQIRIKSTAKELRSVVANWYIILRNLAIVILLSVLVYVGIRIIISSTSSDKAKYKQLLVDWVVAMCLLFSMNYIMSFSNIIVEKITELLTSIEGQRYLVYVPEDGSKILKALQSDDNEAYLKTYGIIPSGASAEDLVVEEDGNKYVQWNTNLMGTVRLKAQESKNETLEYVGYMVMFLMLVLFTAYFVFTYLKRVIYMAFLTLVAPLVAMTYPIDKMNDGKAQAFDMWLKEYIFNLLIQPLHLLLYTILVSSALEFAEKNMLYSIVAIAFMMPAEKLMRKFFGFEKAQTPGVLGGAAGAALAWSGINKLMGHRLSKGSNNGGKSSGNGKTENEDNSSLPRYNDGFDKEDAMLNTIGDNEQKNNLFNGKGNNIGNINNALGIENGPTKYSYAYDKNEMNDMYNGMFDDMYPKSSNVINSAKANNGLNVKNNNKSKKKIKNKALRAALGGTKYYAKGIGKKIVRGVSNSHPLRTAAGIVGGATFAAAGGIIGLTSGDSSKAMQYATAGAIGGYNFGKSASQTSEDLLNSALTVEGTFEAAEKAKYDTLEDYKKAQIEKFAEQKKKDRQFIKRLEENVGEEEASRLLNTTFVDDYSMSGITNEDDLIVAAKMEQKEKMSRDVVKSSIKFGKWTGDTTKMNKPDKDKWQQSIADKFAQKTNDKNAADLGKQVIRNVDLYNKYKNDID